MGDNFEEPFDLFAEYDKEHESEELNETEVKTTDTQQTGSPSPIDATKERPLPTRGEEYVISWDIDGTLLNTVLHAPCNVLRFYLLYKEFVGREFNAKLIKVTLALHVVMIGLSFIPYRTIFSPIETLSSAVLSTILLFILGGLDDERISKYKDNNTINKLSKYFKRK